MVIAKSENSQELAALWLEVSVEAHGFIPESYWRGNYCLMRDEYLPASDNYVLRDSDGRLCGFISVVGGHIHALFIRTQVQGRGYGRMLLNHAKSLYPRLTLAVYEKNTRACGFYLGEGFTEKGRGIDAATGEEEIFMEYSAP